MGRPASRLAIAVRVPNETDDGRLPGETANAYVRRVLWEQGGTGRRPGESGAAFELRRAFERCGLGW